MSFKLTVHKGGLTGMVAVCDICGKVIKDASDANIVWEPDDCQKKGDMADFELCHKSCDDRFRGTAWDELDVGLMYLLSNSKVNIKRAGHLAKLLSET